MTRDFNKQNRNDSRSSFRNNSSNRYGEERSPRPARVRLNRETVDRAWENGAPSLHANYRARSTNGQPSRNNWRSQQNSSSDAPGGNRAYGTRQHNYRDNSQDFERRPDNGYHTSRPRPRPTGPSRQGGDQSRYNNQRGPSSPYRSDEPRHNGYQGRSRNGSGQYDRSTNSRSSYERGSSGRGYDDNRRGSTGYRPNNYSGEEAPQRRGSQINKPQGERPRRGAGRMVHPEKEYRPRVNELKPPRAERPLHPRFLSRPEVRRAHEAKRYEEQAEQFEGDYEQFDTDDMIDATFGGERPDRAPRREYQPRTRRANDYEQERHVTQMPDGRVLKGSRPEQRKNAQFWTDINNDTEALLDQVQPPDSETAHAGQASLEEGKQKVSRVSKPARRATGAPKSKKAEGAETVKKPRSSGPKPSQKGYKWPTS